MRKGDAGGVLFPGFKFLVNNESMLLMFLKKWDCSLACPCFELVQETIEMIGVLVVNNTKQRLVEDQERRLP